MTEKTEQLGYKLKITGVLFLVGLMGGIGLVSDSLYIKLVAGLIGILGMIYTLTTSTKLKLK